MKYPQEYACKYPLNKEKTLLEDYCPTEAECSNNNWQLFICLSYLSIEIVLVKFARIVYKVRRHIRYWIYLLLVKRKGYTNIIQQTTEFVYNGFVIYCNENRKWVCERPLERLDNLSGMKLCIHHRNVHVGKLIVDNISKNMPINNKMVPSANQDGYRC